MTMPLPPITKRAWIDRARAAFTVGPIRCLAHLGLIGGFLLVAWHDLTRQDQRSSTPSAAEPSR